MERDGLIDLLKTGDLDTIELVRTIVSKNDIDFEELIEEVFQIRWYNKF